MVPHGEQSTLKYKKWANWAWARESQQIWPVRQAKTQISLELAQSDQRLRCPPEECLGPKPPGRLWSDWAHRWFEPRYDKTNKMACAPSEDSDQPGHSPSLIRDFAVRMKKAWVLSYSLSAQRRLWSDWADAQADLSLRWAHSHFVCFVRRWLSYSVLIRIGLHYGHHAKVKGV